MIRTRPAEGMKPALPLLSCKILLRHARTGLYYQNVARWTVTAIEAFDFKKVDLAVGFASDSGLEAVEVVMDYGENGEISLPVTELVRQ